MALQSTTALAMPNAFASAASPSEGAPSSCTLFSFKARSSAVLRASGCISLKRSSLHTPTYSASMAAWISAALVPAASATDAVVAFSALAMAATAAPHFKPAPSAALTGASAAGFLPTPTRATLFTPYLGGKVITLESPGLPLKPESAITAASVPSSIASSAFNSLLSSACTASSLSDCETSATSRSPVHSLALVGAVEKCTSALGTASAVETRSRVDAALDMLTMPPRRREALTRDGASITLALRQAVDETGRCVTARTPAANIIVSTPLAIDALLVSSQGN
mmetsp:Transcript_42679/g.105143  ORF Transcript_42679/g.105143 Transcript_42679/m.105143 type:complete len:283 (-) Transcript_42679:13-861(-)